MTTATRHAHEAEMLAEIARLNALALAAETPGQYEKWSRRANDLEAVLVRMTAKAA